MKIGPYQTIEPLGHGACATVYLAKSPDSTLIALKVLAKDTAISEQNNINRFRCEMKIHRLVPPHPHILPVYDIGEDEKYYYMSMELIPQSKTLEHVIENTPINLNDSIQIMVKISHAVHHLHTHGIIHCDIKPANIMINANKEPKLADLGVAECKHIPFAYTNGSLKGTPLYMSPEQTKGYDDTPSYPSSDVYSLAVVTYELLTHALPYPAIHHIDHVRNVFDAIKSGKITPPRTYRKAITPMTEKVLLKALKLNPAQRYQTALDFAVALELSIQNMPYPPKPNFSLKDIKAFKACCKSLFQYISKTS